MVTPGTHGSSWALLIGVDTYIQGKERSVTYDNLSGCVRDVRTVEAYLRSIGVQNIKLLTASGLSKTGTPIEDFEIWPVYGNIERELNRITENAIIGDLVYIHYSGHGVRRDSFESQQDGDGDKITGTALALADVMAGGAYLTGYQLGVFVKKMVLEKQLRVTLVLDSCFSGRGHRNSKQDQGGAIRTAEGGGLDDSIPLPSDIIVEERALDLDHQITASLASRTATIKRSWLSNPVGCTILTACEFDQVAREHSFEDGESHGLFTYCMLEILKRNPKIRRPTHAKVKDYIASKILSDYTTKQSPVLYGDGEYVFFGKEKVIERPNARILRREGDEVELDLGWAQGVSEGAIYTVSSNGHEGAASIQAYIISAPKETPFRSAAQFLMEDSNIQRKELENIQSLVLQKWALPEDIIVQVSLNQEGLESELDLLRTELEETPGLLLATGDINDEVTFIITLSQNGTFEIREKEERLPRIPRLSIKDEKWVQKLAHIIGHLARYRALKSIHNDIEETQIAPEEFILTVSDTSGKTVKELIHESDGKYHITHGSRIKLSIKRSKICERKDIFVSFYNFSPEWGIYKLHPEHGQSSRKIPKTGKEWFEVDMEIPVKSSDSDPEEVDDLIRIFLCNGAVSWEEIEMAGLPADSDTVMVRNEENISKENKASGRTRAIRDGNRPGVEDKWINIDLVIHTSPAPCTLS